MTPPGMASLPNKIVAVHSSLDRSGIPHAFGGALALAWCTERARGTIDIDVNIFAEVSASQEVLGALPDDVVWSTTDLQVLRRDGQVRLWWGTTPLDVFLNTTEFHARAAERCRKEPFAARSYPFCRVRTSPCSRPSSTEPRTGRIWRRWRPPARWPSIR